MNTPTLRHLSFLVVPFFMLSIGLPTLADEIHYGSIETVRNNTVLLHYTGPSGESYYTCSRDTFECDREGDDMPELFPSVYGSRTYPTSPLGTYGIRTFTVLGKTYHFLMSVEDDEAEAVSLIPVPELFTRDTWSRDETKVALLGISGTTYRYDIPTETLTTIETETSVPFFILSPEGTYLTSYNYVDEGHYLWNFETGNKTLIPSDEPQAVEVSDNENYLTYQNSDNLILARTSAPTTPIRTITTSNRTIIDYIFLDNILYYITNNGSDPYDWKLVAHNPKTGSEETVDSNVSYGIVMEVIGDTLAYSKIEGKNRNIFLYNPEAKTARALDAVSESPVSENLTRRGTTLDGVHSVIVEPEDADDDVPLFVWLHGGPQRQTSVGFHSYLSYAVYDELLEQFADAGAYVLKVDYTGSFGYGQAFIEKLKQNIGKDDVASVRKAVAEFTDDHDVGNIYLIGNSYGGYLALRALTEAPNTFDGAISINGVTDWHGLATRIPSTPFAELFNGTPDTHNIQDYFAASIYTGVAETLSTSDKMLLFYGENDASVPNWQSKEFHAFAEENNKSSELIELPDTGHIPQERDILTDICEEISDYFSISVSCRS